MAPYARRAIMIPKRRWKRQPEKLRREVSPERHSEGQVLSIKAWPSQFFKRRKLVDDGNLVDFAKEFAVGEVFETFVKESGEAASPSEVKLTEYCKGMTLEWLTLGRFPSNHRRLAWLDDRCKSSGSSGGNARRYENPLTATALMRALSEKRFGHEELTDAARRLIYISDLDPSCIYALAATGPPPPHTQVLRDAVYKHLSGQTSIAVKIPSTGFLAFQLVLHIRCLLLRNSKPPQNPAPELNTKPRREWTDLPFLQPDGNERQNDSELAWGLQEAQISVVIAGVDDRHWVAYGFVDGEIDGSPADLCDADGEDGQNFDPIASDVAEVEASVPIWAPRDYWLRVFEIRLGKVREEWEQLVLGLEEGCTKCVC